MPETTPRQTLPYDLVAEIERLALDVVTAYEGLGESEADLVGLVLYVLDGSPAAPVAPREAYVLAAASAVRSARSTR